MSGFRRPFEVVDYEALMRAHAPPPEYFEGDYLAEPDVIEEMGDDRILFETDYPHPDSKYPKAVQTFLDQEKISDESKRKILWDNALDFYRFDEKDLPTEYLEATG